MAQTPSRRGVLSFAGLLPLAIVPALPAIAANPDPDAELIALCAEFDRLEAAYRESMYDGPAGTVEESEADAEQTRIGDAQRELAERMHYLRATTLAGHVARARSFVGWAPDMVETYDGTEDLLRSAIFRDLTGQPVVPATMVLTSSPSSPERDEAVEYDTAIMATCKQHIANIKAYNSGPDVACDINPLWHAYERTREAIHQAEPRTFAGIYAKARAAKAEAVANSRDGVENPDGTPAEFWAWDIVNDLLRLAGEG